MTKITLTIPGRFYDGLRDVRNFRSGNGYGGNISAEAVFSDYADVMHDLSAWLLDQTKDFGYRTASFRTMEWSGNRVTLAVSDNPEGLDWVAITLKHVSDQFGFSDLFIQWSETDWG